MLTRSLRFLPLAGALLALAPACHADTTCSSGRPQLYHAQPGDRSTNTGFEAHLSPAGAHSLKLNACAGDLRIVSGSASPDIRISITAGDAHAPLGGLVRAFNVRGGDVVVDLVIPAHQHPVITLMLPRRPALDGELNLGAGTVELNGDALSGTRDLNVGAGTATLRLSDRDYASLSINVGMGSLDDRRPGGHGSFLVVHRQIDGKGKGDIDVNVGAGKVVLEAGEQ